ncbi:DUF2911 domain-containing protein [uncultured Fibrella sp.]|uniref:DUF2911 domain-containing protein n=1 Tax=uncultured Fibrella sp. TaxID=1284596 RepID=UPI0035CA806B
MKQTVSLLVLMLLAMTATVGFAQNAKSPHLTVESPDKTIKVVYGQPSKRGRVIFGPEGVTSLEKYGKPWRTGADAATEITFKNDVMFGGKMVKAGTYTLVTIPNEKEWSVILNTVLGQWGAYDYDKHVAKNVLEVKVPAVASKMPVEKLTITPTNKSVSIAWDTAMITIPVMNHGMSN